MFEFTFAPPRDADEEPAPPQYLCAEDDEPSQGSTLLVADLAILFIKHGTVGEKGGTAVSSNARKYVAVMNGREQLRQHRLQVHHHLPCAHPSCGEAFSRRDTMR